MTTKKPAISNLKTGPAAVRQPSSSHRLDALLHTMRCITQYEDALCELSHELKRAGALSPEARDQLRDILQKIPSDDYVVDLESVRAILAEPRLSESSKKIARPTRARKNSLRTKKKSGRKSSI